MVEMCRAKGLTAYAMDFLSLDFPAQSFDAVYALNCLLHVPKQEFARVMQAIQRLMKPGGLFFLGIYGGNEFEGISEHDTYSPKRFFSFYTDEQLRTAVTGCFDIRSFKQVPLEDETEYHFQSLILTPLALPDSPQN
jgi:SAM-dependent methyltransferase